MAARTKDKIEADLESAQEELAALRSGVADMVRALTWCADEGARILWRDGLVAVRVADIDRTARYTPGGSPFPALIDAVRAVQERAERRRARIGVI
jgi:cob(I)alamin adenosyltransferase